MTTRLIGLHGFTMNGAGLRHMLGELAAQLPGDFELRCPDAPNTCSEESVRGLGELMGGFRPKPPNCEWWNASDDGRQYLGWERSVAMLREEAGGQRSLALIGFSQGAAAAAGLAALAQRGEFPAVRCVILVAGFPPRADALRAAFEVPIEVPSLHVWGDADRFAKHSPRLFECFAANTREQYRWPGGHTIPGGAAALSLLIDFLQHHTRAKVSPR